MGRMGQTGRLLVGRVKQSRPGEKCKRIRLIGWAARVLDQNQVWATEKNKKGFAISLQQI
jgi:hypothetical protein